MTTPTKRKRIAPILQHTIYLQYSVGVGLRRLEESMTSNRHRPHYHGRYYQLSKAVRQAAYANPLTLCWRCQKTYAQGLELYGREGAAWQAGHLVDGQPRSPLVAEHAHCNQSASHRARASWKQKQQRKSPNA